ncbi:acyl carrier protein [Haploplasma axanthum]|uniref:D-alanine--poly(Phosphoribitol) ligase subunit 2 n=1 Tax=Haploplasma axanthum TaxID=29552 RepID=A0A449BE77_HAPAX|nr:acyl carrier protein [Haploplasma axanthum]VEU80735.1 D-alanine--poly(phosphoribitol) ligase subunit 2 [Haploplasma axanthum]
MEKLLNILNEIKPDIDFETNEELIDAGILESLDIMQIVAEISDQFDVQLSPSDIIPDNFNSAKELWAMIERLK